MQASVSTEVVEEVADYIPEGLLGLVIGKRHATIKKLERDTGALLTPRRGKITIKGTALQTRLGHAAIKEILVCRYNG